MNIEPVVTVGLRRGSQPLRQFSSLMEELRRLVETAGGEVREEFTQHRDRPDPATLIGEGKVEQVAQAVRTSGVRTVIFDDDLTPAQQKNIEKMMPKVKVVDRTRLILDIFAQRARTREGQLQIELAQLVYMVPRLTGSWRGFSQQLGGIGVRGPGERKIEVERRYARERIKRLQEEIEEIRLHRDLARSSRETVPLPQIALVGYTNVGKSTLLNALVGERAVYADDKLFATLDPTTRRVKLPGGRVVLFTDTVGFIQKLPPALMAAFRATLEESARATLIIHVEDATADHPVEQRRTVLDVIKDMKADHISMITAINKIDQLPRGRAAHAKRPGAIPVSAKTGEGIDALLSAVEKKLDENLMEVTFELPHARRALLSTIYRAGHVLSERAGEKSSTMKVLIDSANWNRLSEQLGGSAK